MPTRSKSPALAFSYQRFSSTKQADGDSIRRQTALRDAWVEKAGAVLDTSLTLRDEGVSAFTGTHRANPDRHALAAFLELVRQGRIPRGSYLIVESLDRLSREHIRPALTLLLNLIDQGIRIVQLLPVEAVYDEQVEPMQLMMAIMELSRGHSESKVKSERVAHAWTAKKRKAAEGTIVTRQLPRWVKVKGGKLVLDEAKAEAVRRIFQLTLDGYGMTAITKLLNAEKVPVVGDSPFWSRSYVKKVLTNRAVVGEYVPHREARRVNGHSRKRVPDGPAVPNYYPAVVSEETFYAARAAARQRDRKGGRPVKKMVNLFAGLLRDARDGGRVAVYSYQQPTAVATRYLAGYRSKLGAGGLKPVSFPLEVFEEAVLSKLREVDPREVLPRKDRSGDKVVALAGRYAGVEGRLEAIKAKLVDGDGDVGPLVDAIRALEAERVAVGEELAAARQEAASPLAEVWGGYPSLVDALRNAPDPEAARVRLRAALRRMVSEVWCLFVKRGLSRVAAVQVRFDGGAHRDYLVYYRAAYTRGRVTQTARWEVRSFADPDGKSELDPRDPAKVAALERFLATVDLDGLLARLNAGGERPTKTRRAGKEG